MVFSFANQKGGVGKTTSAMNLAVTLADLGVKILVIDFDPQANLTSGLGYSNNETKKRGNIYNVLIDKAKISEIFIPTRIKNLFLVPSSIELAGAEIELVSMMNRENILNKAIERVKEQYDAIFIDCPPSLGILTINAFTATDKIIIPVQCEYFALEGLGQLLETIKLVKGNLNPALEVGGVLMTMFDSRTKLSEEVVIEVKNYFKSNVFEVIIPRNVRLSEAPSHGKSIIEFDNSSKGAKAYRDLAKEFMKKYITDNHKNN